MNDQHLSEYDDDHGIPLGITFLVALGIVQGAVAILLGLFLVLDRNDAELIDQTEMTSSVLTSVGIGLMVGGAIHLLLALALRRGNAFVRFLFGIFALINVAGSLWAIVGTHGEQRAAASVSLVFGLLVVWILFGSDRSARFFSEAHR